MATFKSNMAQAASDMLDLPTNLEGILQDVQKQQNVRETSNQMIKGKFRLPRSSTRNGSPSRQEQKVLSHLKVTTFGLSSFPCARTSAKFLWKSGAMARLVWCVLRKTYFRHCECVL